MGRVVWKRVPAAWHLKVLPKIVSCVESLVCLDGWPAEAFAGADDVRLLTADGTNGGHSLGCRGGDSVGVPGIKVFTSNGRVTLVHNVLLASESITHVDVIDRRWRIAEALGR
jgi:hypothetical protein